MGNIPAKLTGKYQSYDISTPSQITPPMTLKRNSNQLNQNMTNDRNMVENSYYEEEINYDQHSDQHRYYNAQHQDESEHENEIKTYSIIIF